MTIRYKAGTYGYAMIDGVKHYCEVDKDNRKGVRVRYQKRNPSSCWKAADLATVRYFVPYDKAQF